MLQAKYDPDRLTSLGWTLNFVNWGSLAGFFILSAVGAPKYLVAIDACIFVGSVLLFKFLDEVTDSIHRPRHLGASESDSVDAQSTGTDRDSGA